MQIILAYYCDTRWSIIPNRRSYRLYSKHDVKLCRGNVKMIFIFKMTYTFTFQLSEMIAHEFLGHQVQDTKELANMYHTIKRMKKDHLSNYLFDKNL